MTDLKQLTFELYLIEKMVFDGLPDGAMGADGLKAVFKDQAANRYYVSPAQLGQIIEVATTHISSGDIDKESLSQCLRLLNVATQMVDILGKSSHAKRIRSCADDLAQIGHKKLFNIDS